MMAPTGKTGLFGPFWLLDGRAVSVNELLKLGELTAKALKPSSNKANWPSPSFVMVIVWDTLGSRAVA